MATATEQSRRTVEERPRPGLRERIENLRLNRSNDVDNPERSRARRKRVRTGIVGAAYALPVIAGALAIGDNDFGHGATLNNDAEILAQRITTAQTSDEVDRANQRLQIDQDRSIDLSKQNKQGQVGNIASESGHIGAMRVYNNNEEYQQVLDRVKDTNGATAWNAVERTVFVVGMGVGAVEAGAFGVQRVNRRNSNQR